MTKEKIPIIIPVYNTTPETLYLTVYHLSKTTKNPVIVVNDGSKRKETIVTLEFISKRSLAEVLNKDNGGKIDAIIHGLNYVKEKYSSKCVIIQDDDVLITAINENIDETLEKHCNDLDYNYPVYVYQVENRIHVLNKVISEELIKDLEDLEEEIKKVNPTYKVEIEVKPNLLDDLQSIEHTVSTLIARRIAGEGLWVGGTASLWITPELEKYLKQHSKDHYADDLELSLLLRRDGKGVKFSDEIVLYAEFLSKFKAFLKQRVKWSHGAYRALFTYPREFLKTPFYFAYPINPFVLYSIVLAPEILKYIIPLAYFSILIVQMVYYSKKFSLNEEFSRKIKNISKLLGAIYITFTTLSISLILKTYSSIYVVSSITELLGLLVTLEYIVYILNKYGKDVKYINPKNLLLKYVPYVMIYNTIILPLGLIDFLYAKTRGEKRTYKILNK